MDSVTALMDLIAKNPAVKVSTRDRARDVLWHLDRRAWAEMFLRGGL